LRPACPIGTPCKGLPTNTGPLASAAWLVDRGLSPESDRWFVEITLVAADSWLRLEVYAEEWGFAVNHAGRSSWIRVTDVAFAHGPDDHRLLQRLPRLHKFAPFIAELERQFAVRFDRCSPRIRTSIDGAEPVLEAWVANL
jgi:hypothetical protein